jgi:acyl-coenzyme A thioesterase PaaI-like protein
MDSPERTPAPAPAAIAAPDRLARLRAFVFRLGFNFWPCIRGSGGRVVHLAPDFTRITVRLPLNWRTRNAVGTIFGGSMFAATDPMYMLMLQRQLGRAYVVWDKGSAIRFKRPAQRTLFAHFHVTPEMLAQVRETVAACGEADFTWPVRLEDAGGVVHAEIDRTLYVADKAFYKRKQDARTARTQELAA